MVQRLRLHASNAGGVGSIPGQGTKIPHATRCGQITIIIIIKKKEEVIEGERSRGRKGSLVARTWRSCQRRKRVRSAVGRESEVQGKVFVFIFNFIYLFFGCVRSSLLCTGFL